MFRSFKATAKIYICHISDIKSLESLYNCKARSDKASPCREKDIMRSLLLRIFCLFVTITLPKVLHTAAKAGLKCRIKSKSFI